MKVCPNWPNGLKPSPRRRSPMPVDSPRGSIPSAVNEWLTNSAVVDGVSHPPLPVSRRTMKKIALDAILGFSAYENVRQEYRQQIIDKKKSRRVAVGDKVSLVFENRDTVIF